MIICVYMTLLILINDVNARGIVITLKAKVIQKNIGCWSITCDLWFWIIIIGETYLVSYDVLWYNMPVKITFYCLKEILFFVICLSKINQIQMKYESGSNKIILFCVDLIFSVENVFFILPHYVLFNLISKTARS